jgi:ATP-dependent protease Clp ATPase subunit
VDFADEAEEHEELKGVVFDCSKIMWCLAGAFVRLEGIVKRRLHNTSLPPEESWKFAVPSDFHAYGMLSELVGRISTWAYVVPLKQMEIMKILKEQEVPRWIALFDAVGCVLTIDDGALGRASEAAFFDKTGARGGMAFLRRSMEDIYVEISSHHVTQATVDARTIVTGRLELDTVVV